MSLFSINKIKIKRKRNISTVLSYFPNMTTYSELHNIMNPSNSTTLLKINSQPDLLEKSKASKSLNDLNLNRSKIMTPKNKNILEHSIFSKNVINNKKMENQSIFFSILTKIENIMFYYRKNNIKLNNLLIIIENFIDSLISNKKNEISYNKKLSDNINKKACSLKKNCFHFFDEIKAKNEFNSLNEIKESKKETENNILKIKINKLYQKINEMEVKFRIDELKYFFCIGEHQKKINELEKKINMKNIDKMPKEELKKFLCYPHYIKFDVKDDVNPRSIPMFNLRRKKCQTSTNRGKTRVSYTSSEEKLFDNYFKKIYDDNDNDIALDEIKNNKDENEKNKISEINEIKNTIKLGKKNCETQISLVDKFFGKSKNFFISHPKLNYIKVGKDGNQLTSWKIDNQLNNFPQQISKLKISKSQKNAIIVFPSSFNETMMNLEKLRTNKNFKSIKNKFEETLKLKKKSFKN